VGGNFTTKVGNDVELNGDIGITDNAGLDASHDINSQQDQDRW